LIALELLKKVLSLNLGSRLPPHSETTVFKAQHDMDIFKAIKSRST